MTLSEEEKQRIEEEEKIRAEAKQKYEKPKKRGISKKMGCFVIIILFAVVGLIASLSSKDKTNTNNTTATTNTVAVNTAKSNTNTQTKEDAQKELDDLMALSKTSDLVTSYEFSDTATVVYVGSTWYTQTVQFKKDFLAKVALLKEKTTGYKHFEARDALSNEKVGEVTSFTGSLEVYK